MPYRARVLRRASAKRAEAVLARRRNGEERVTLCARPITRCLEAGQHVPVCRCVLPSLHYGPCTSGSAQERWWK